MSELHGHTEEDEAKDDMKFFKKWHRDSSVFKRNGSLIFFFLRTDVFQVQVVIEKLVLLKVWIL